MAFIKTISVREANDELRSIYGMIRTDMVGSVPLPVGWTAWNVMRVLSLRPRLLWAFERGFRNLMWDGELSRLSKEAIGVSVAQANACPYCREAHVGFLQAAGMPARLTRIFERDPVAAPVAPDLHEFVTLAVKVSTRPAEVAPEDLKIAYSAAHSPREYYDAVGVMVGFNFSARVANSLGVAPEIPRWMRRVEPLRRVGLRAIALYCRLFVDLGRKGVRGPTSSEHLAALRVLFVDLGLGELPAWVERLTMAPPVLATLRELLEALARRNPTTGAIGFDASRFRLIGRTVLASIPNAETLSRLANHAQPDAADVDDAARSALITRFANDVALRSYKLTRERVDELRTAGLDDADILDVVATTALWCAAARLEVLTGSLPTVDPNDQQDERRRLSLARFLPVKPVASERGVETCA